MILLFTLIVTVNTFSNPQGREVTHSQDGGVTNQFIMPLHASLAAPKLLQKKTTFVTPVAKNLADKLDFCFVPKCS